MERLLLNKQPLFQVPAPTEAGTGTGGTGSSSRGRHLESTSPSFPKPEESEVTGSQKPVSFLPPANRHETL